MTVDTLITQLRAIRLVPVIALDIAEDAPALGKALLENGLPVAEITFRSPAAADAIRRLREAYPDLLIAAGTVLTREQVQNAKAAGADFIVSPGFNPNIVKACQDLELPITPGVNNPMAIEAALELGVTTVKFFPAEASGGIAMLKALLAPYSMLSVMPTGGIGMSNIRDYLAIKNVIACGGSWMVEKSLLAQKNWAEIARLSREAAALAQA